MQQPRPCARAAAPGRRRRGCAAAPPPPGRRRRGRSPSAASASAGRRAQGGVRRGRGHPRPPPARAGRPARRRCAWRSDRPARTCAARISTTSASWAAPSSLAPARGRSRPAAMLHQAGGWHLRSTSSASRRSSSISQAAAARSRPSSEPHPPPTVGCTDQVHDHVDGRRHLLAHGDVRQLEPGHQHHRLDPPHGVGGRACVHGRQRPVVAGVHRLQHVQRLAAAHLADHDPVGPHAKRVSHERPQRHLASALDVGRPALEAGHVRLRQAQLGGVLDGDDPLGRVDEPRQRVQQRRLAGARAPPDTTTFSRPRTHRSSSSACARGEAPGGDQVGDVEGQAGELADGEQRPVHRHAAAGRRSRGCRRAGGRRPSGSTRRRAGRPSSRCGRSPAAGAPRRGTRPARARAGRRARCRPANGPFAITSVTPRSRSSGSSGPIPTVSSTTPAIRRRASAGSSSNPSARTSSHAARSAAARRSPAGGRSSSSRRRRSR